MRRVDDGWMMEKMMRKVMVRRMQEDDGRAQKQGEGIAVDDYQKCQKKCCQ